MRRVMLLDDEANVLNALKRLLRQHFGADMAVEVFTDPERALLRLGEATFDIVVADYHMPGMDGVTFLKAVRSIDPEAVRIALSASTEFKAVLKAVNEAEVFRFIMKPWEQEDVRSCFTIALEKRDRAVDERKQTALRMEDASAMTRYEMEARRLEQLEPGITRVRWSEDGSVLLDEE